MTEPPPSPTPPPPPPPPSRSNPPAGAGSTPPSGPGPLVDADARRRYWRTNLLYLAILLSIWFVVSYVLGILLAPALDNVKLGGAPLGFWFAQQGSIYVFVLLILAYVVLMNKLDRKHGFRED